jgi:hypothetical protein
MELTYLRIVNEQPALYDLNIKEVELSQGHLLESGLGLERDFDLGVYRLLVVDLIEKGLGVGCSMVLGF